MQLVVIETIIDFSLVFLGFLITQNLNILVVLSIETMQA